MKVLKTFSSTLHLEVYKLSVILLRCANVLLSVEKPSESIKHDIKGNTKVNFNFQVLKKEGKTKLYSIRLNNFTSNEKINLK